MITELQSVKKSERARHAGSPVDIMFSEFTKPYPTKRDGKNQRNNTRKDTAAEPKNGFHLARADMLFCSGAISFFSPLSVESGSRV